MADTCMALPQDCWELILNRLKNSDLEATSLVCKEFFSVSNSLRHSLKVHKSTAPQVLCRLFERFQHLKRIDLSSFQGDLDSAVLEIVQSGLNLEALNVSHQKALSVEHLRVLGCYMKKLKTLELTFSPCLQDSDLAVISSSMPHLEELDISFQRWDYITDAGIEALASKLKDLRKINISGNNLSDESLLSLSSHCVFLREIIALECGDYITENSIGFLFSHSPHLVSLSLKSVLVDYSPSSSSFSIENSIGFAKALRALEISEAFISDRFLSSIAKVHSPLKKLKLQNCENFSISGLSLLLHACQSIEELDLEGTEFLTDEHMNDLSQYLHSATYINLSECSKLTDSTFFILTRNCPSLVQLKMKRTSLGAKEDFGMDLVKNQQIQILRLGCNNYLNDGSLKRIGFSCPNLSLLDVSHCQHITSEGIGEIFKTCSKIGHLEM